MSDDGWRTSIRWVVAHPIEPKVLLGRRDGALCLPGTERPGRAWTAEPGQVLPALRDLLGVEALRRRSLDEHAEPSAQVQRATLLAVPRALPALPDGLAWAGRAELAGPDAHVADAEDVAERPGGRDGEDVPKEGQPRVGQGGRVLEPGLGGRQPGRGQGLGRGRHDPAVGRDGQQVEGGAEGDQGHPRDPAVGEQEHRPDRVGGHQQQRAQPVGQAGQPDAEDGQAEGGVDRPHAPEVELDQGAQPPAGQRHGQRAQRDQGDEEHRRQPYGNRPGAGASDHGLHRPRTRKSPCGDPRVLGSCAPARPWWRRREQREGR